MRASILLKYQTVLGAEETDFKMIKNELLACMELQCDLFRSSLCLIYFYNEYGAF